MTEQFVSAAELMGRVLGMPGYPFAVIDHPVSSMGDDRLQEMAGRVVAEVRGRLLADGA